MADWRISEKYRKPRRTKGTPLYYHRSYWALGVLGIGGLAWYFFEQTKLASTLRYNTDLFTPPEGFQSKVDQFEAGLENPAINAVFAKARDREAHKFIDHYEEKSENQTWFFKFFTSKPDM